MIDAGDLELGRARRGVHADGRRPGDRDPLLQGRRQHGTHVGSLWSATGDAARHGDVHQRDGAPAGRRSMFSKPVAITAGTTYVAAYFAPNGHYSATPSVCLGGFDNLAAAKRSPTRRQLRWRLRLQRPPARSRRTASMRPTTGSTCCSRRAHEQARADGQRGPRDGIACGLSPLAAALLLAACGGSSSSTSTLRLRRHLPPPALTPPVARESRAPARSRRSRSPSALLLLATAARDRDGSGQSALAAAAGTIDDEVNASGSKTLNPCTPASRSEAVVLTPASRSASPSTRPQDPCALTRRGARGASSTLSVEATDFSKVQPQAQSRDRVAVEVNGHAAYCGLAGSPT